MAWPSRLPSGPRGATRLISLAMMVAASSQEMRSKPDLPRLRWFLAPLGSQSTLFMGYMMRSSE